MENNTLQSARDQQYANFVIDFEQKIETKSPLRGSNCKYKTANLIIMIGVFIFVVLSLIYNQRPKQCPQIIHIWIGTVPDRYVKQLQYAQYKYLLLSQTEWLEYTARFAKQYGIDFTLLNFTRKSMKSDILRFLYLYYHGGVYFDIDFQFTKQCLDFVTQLYAHNDFELIMGEQQLEPYAIKSTWIESNPIIVKSTRSKIIYGLLTQTNWQTFSAPYHRYNIKLVKFKAFCIHRYDRSWQI